jgi:topoisomerase-4 subunit B
VRNKKETYYCYTDEERVNAIKKLGDSAEITRFKGLGEISDHEFKNFIGEDIRLDQVILRKEDAFNDLLEFYRGKNTPQRRDFIIENLVIEEDVPKEA